ncbi:neuronal cell adhesion molecule-like isoform X3 [Clavelina lepadiformis]|uniref:neuronal cell adhesion molecule-like isoform X3 n=1 Tax=Clavelina lepadiformis TaxID=159417 RepID=UPI004041A2F7
MEENYQAIKEFVKTGGSNMWERGSNYFVLRAETIGPNLEERRATDYLKPIIQASNSTRSSAKQPKQKLSFSSLNSLLCRHKSRCRKMEMWTIVMISLVLTLQIDKIAAKLEVPPEVPRPPQITTQSASTVYAVEESLLELKCEADGQPKVDQDGYIWKKDGESLDLTAGDIVQSENSGNITFSGTDLLKEEELRHYEGIYQCFASNGIGTAVTGNIAVKVAATPSPNRQDKDLSAVEGASLTVPCDHEGLEGITVSWDFEGTKPDERRVGQTADGSLVFSNVIAEDDGLEFWCQIKKRVSRRSADGPHYTLNVDRSNPVTSRGPDIVSPVNRIANPVEVLLGDDLVLECTATGSPTPIINWEVMNGDWPQGRYKIEDFGRKVTITNLTYVDGKTYQCTASNDVESVSSGVRVTVKSRPFFSLESQKPLDVIQVPGKSVNITCDPSGLPKPTTKWLVNGVPIEETPTMENRKVTSNWIKLKNLKKEDSAVYQCIASNPYGTVIEQAYVNVLTSPPIPLSSNADNYKSVERSTVKMNCSFFGSSPPKVTCSKGGVDISSMDRFSIVKHKQTKQLKIEGVTRDDAGLYTCVAVNEYGNSSIDFTLDVLKPTSIKIVGPDSVIKGNTVSFRAVVKAESAADEVVWYRSEVPKGRGETFTISDADYSDSGTYKVSVSTKYDKSWGYVTLTVKDRPSPPERFNFSTNKDSKLDVNFNWTPGAENNDEITEYKIEFEEDNFEPGTWQVLRDSIDPSLRSTSEVLSLYVNYKFRLLARNSVGWSDPSAETRRYSTPGGAPKNPTGVRGEGTSPNNMIITWSRVRGIDQNGPGLEYLVSYRKAGNGSSAWNTAPVEDPLTSYTVENTEPYKPYEIIVQSKNDFDVADVPEMVRGYSGEDVPLVTPNNVKVKTFDEAPRHVLVSWEAVDPTLVRGRFLGYKIFYGMSSDNEADEKVVECKPNVTETYVSNLFPNTQYWFSVAVYNRMYTGNKSEKKIVTTPEGAPGRPTSLTLKRRNATSLFLTWNKPKENWGKVVMYVVTYGPPKDPENEITENTGEQKFTVKNLNPDTYYNIRVKARSRQGMGEEEVLQTRTLRSGIPSTVPFSLDPGSTTTNITWISSPDKPDFMPANSFYVKYVDGNGNENQTPPKDVEDGDKQSITIEGLEPDTEYKFVLVLVNGAGPTEIHSTASTEEAAVTSGSFATEIWFIVLMCLLGVVIILLLVVCFVRKGKGGKYSVAEKEGRLFDAESQPMTKEETGEYNDETDDVKRPLSSTFADGPANGNSKAPPSDYKSDPPLRTRGDSVAGDSIEEFADTDAKEFNEDGSFIGQYGVINESAATSTAASPNGDVETSTQIKGDAV